MIIHPSVTGLEAANYYLQHIITFIERSTTTEFKIKTGDVSVRTGIFVGCSSGVAATSGRALLHVPGRNASGICGSTRSETTHSVMG